MYSLFVLEAERPRSRDQLSRFILTAVRQFLFLASPLASGGLQAILDVLGLVDAPF